MSLGLMLFISFGDMDRGIECLLSKIADATTPHLLGDTLEGWDAIQRDPGRLKR